MMQKYPKIFVSITALVGLVFYVSWSGFNVPLPDTSKLDIQVESLDESNFDSNGPLSSGLTVVAFAPDLRPTDYASPVHLVAKLTPYFDAAKTAGLFDGPAVVLLPAHTMTPLLAIGYGSRVYNASSFEMAAMPIIAQNLLEFGKNYFIFESEQPIAAAFIRTQSKIAATAIQTVFGGLAEKYGVYIVPGSGLLMTPGVYPDALAYGHGPIFHTSFVFGPNGKAMEDAIRQVAVHIGLNGLAKTSLPELLPTFSVEGFSIAVAIGSDVTDPAVAAHLKDVYDLDLILSPALKRMAPTHETPVMSIGSNLHGWGYNGSDANVTAKAASIDIAKTEATSTEMDQILWFKLEADSP